MGVVAGGRAAAPLPYALSPAAPVVVRKNYTCPLDPSPSIVAA